MTVLRVLEYVNDALFVGLAGVCFIHWRRQGGAAAAWLAVTFGVLAGAVVAGLALSAAGPAPRGLAAQLATKLLLAAVFLFPYLLFRFTATLERPARRTEAAAGVLAGAVLACTLALPSLPEPDDPRPGWLSAYLAVVVVQWTSTSLIVAVRLWRAGRGQPTAARRRMRGLSIGAASLSLVIVVAGVAPSDGSTVLAVATSLMTTASALLFYLAFAPPTILRNAWRQPELAMLRAAMGELRSVARAEDVAACLLPHVVGMVGGRGAALLDGSGALIGSHGQTPGAPAGHDDAVRLLLSTGTLLVWGSPYTPVFGRQELEWLRALGSLAELALERVRIADRDAELAAVVGASGDAIVSTALDGTISSWNPAAETTYGRPAGQVVGRPLSTLFPDDRSEEVGELLGRVAKGQRVSLETRHLRQDGDPFSVSLTAAPLRKGADAVIGMAIVARDITDRKRAEHALREAKEAADRANAAKSEFLSRMSHELRTPLNAILGFGQLLQLEDLTEEQSESVEHILRGGRHLLGLINEVLDISRIESGHLALSPEPVDVLEVVKNSVDLIQPLAAEREIRIHRPSPDDGPWTVDADRQRLEQVLLNLASNAVKYNRHGGSIRFACHATVRGTVTIVVQDSGAGIPAAKMARLFTPFDRLDAEQSDVPGTGMGLALSKGLVEAMGGTLTAQSTEGRGTTFTIELAEAAAPAEARGPDQGSAPPPAPGPDDRDGQVVLYVEDNEANLRLVERVLAERGGVRLLTTDRGEAVQGLVRQQRPDLVLLDLHLPDIGGEEVLRRLQADRSTAAVPVVMVTADVTPWYRERLLAAGASEYLTKPLDVPRFRRVLDDLLSKVPSQP